MAKKVRFHPKVATDIQIAVNWYDHISPALGARFRKAVKSRIATVQRRPESFGRLEGERRAAPIKGFPYLVLFCFLPEQVIILGVLHTASDPSTWSRRQL